MGSASKQELSAEAHAAVQLPKATIDTGYASAAFGSLSAQSSEIAASGRSSSLSPQPSLHPHNGVPQEQQEGFLPSSADQAAQAPAPAAQDEGPWQKVRAPRRKAGSQQAASEATVCKAPTQGRAAPDQEKLPPSHPREVQAAAQRAEVALPNSEKAAVPSDAWPASEAAEHLAGSKPQQSSRHGYPDPVLHPEPQAHPSSGKHEPVQASSAYGQVRIMAYQ